MLDDEDYDEVEGYTPCLPLETTTWEGYFFSSGFFHFLSVRNTLGQGWPGSVLSGEKWAINDFYHWEDHLLFFFPHFLGRWILTIGESDCFDSVLSTFLLINIALYQCSL